MRLQLIVSSVGVAGARAHEMYRPVNGLQGKGLASVYNKAIGRVVLPRLCSFHIDAGSGQRLDNVLLLAGVAVAGVSRNGRAAGAAPQHRVQLC